MGGPSLDKLSNESFGQMHDRRDLCEKVFVSLKIHDRMLLPVENLTADKCIQWVYASKIVFGLPNKLKDRVSDCKW